MDDTEIGDNNMSTPIKTLPITPTVGMLFDSYEDAYDFYNLYAKDVGFGVRVRNSYKGKISHEKIGAVLCCVHYGQKVDNEVSNPRPGKRVNCDAMIRIKLNNLHKWVITEIILEHNHNTTPSSVRFYGSHKQISAKVKQRLELNSDSGIRTNKSYHSLMVQAGGPEKLTFDEKDVRNYVDNYKRLKLAQGDAQAMHEYFCRMQTKNSNFFYLMDFDDEGRLRNVFWADARSRVSYEFFGDAITFDTTYLTNRYDMPFAPFVGVNHHGQSILLGCGLLADETIESFVWLFKAWLTCMSGRAPPAIITDQCKAMQNAVSQVFQGTRHRFCLWHIMQKLPQKLSGYNEYKSIKWAVEAAVYDSLRQSEFESSWEEMVSKYGLEDNEWLQSLYDDREKWAPVFLKGTFFAGMSTTQRSESMNAFFDGYVYSRTTLSEFASKYTLALKDKHEKEAKADFLSRQSQPIIKTKCAYEKQVSMVYTHGIFKKFQAEVEEMFSCFNVTQVRSEGSIVTYTVKERRSYVGDISNIVSFEVLYNPTETEVFCICNLFNFKGYLCRHALCVLHYNGIEELPSQYILSRWRKDFKRRYLQESLSMDINYDDSGRWYDQLHMRAIQLVEEGIASKKHFEIAISDLDESLRKLRLIECENYECAREVLLPNMSKKIIRDHVQSKRPGRPKSCRLKPQREKVCKGTKKNKKKNDGTKTQGEEHLVQPSLQENCQYGVNNNLPQVTYPHYGAGSFQSLLASQSIPVEDLEPFLGSYDCMTVQPQTRDSNKSTSEMIGMEQNTEVSTDID